MARVIKSTSEISPAGALSVNGSDQIFTAEATAEQEHFIAASGQDTFIFGEGSSTLSALDEISGIGLEDTIDLSALGLSPEDVEFRVVGNTLKIIQGFGSDDFQLRVELNGLTTENIQSLIIWDDEPTEPEPTDAITGTSGADVLTGTDGDDVINALGGNDRVWFTSGDDIIDLGDGFDQMNYVGSASDYTITENADGTITVVKPDGGTDTISSVEGMYFGGEDQWYDIDTLLDGVVTPPSDEHIIHANPGTETLQGTDGVDRFVFEEGDTHTGQIDIISGWAAGDIIDLSALGLSADNIEVRTVGSAIKLIEGFGTDDFQLRINLDDNNAQAILDSIVYEDGPTEPNPEYDFYIDASRGDPLYLPFNFVLVDAPEHGIIWDHAAGDFGGLLNYSGISPVSGVHHSDAIFYTPNHADGRGAFNYPEDGYTGTDYFSYTTPGSSEVFTVHVSIPGRTFIESNGAGDTVHATSGYDTFNRLDAGDMVVGWQPGDYFITNIEDVSYAYGISADGNTLILDGAYYNALLLIDLTDVDNIEELAQHIVLFESDYIGPQYLNLTEYRTSVHIGETDTPDTFTFTDPYDYHTVEWLPGDTIDLSAMLLESPTVEYNGDFALIVHFNPGHRDSGEINIIIHDADPQDVLDNIIWSDVTTPPTLPGDDDVNIIDTPNEYNHMLGTDAVDHFVFDNITSTNGDITTVRDWQPGDAIDVSGAGISEGMLEVRTLSDGMLIKLIEGFGADDVQIKIETGGQDVQGILDSIIYDDDAPSAEILTEDFFIF